MDCETTRADVVVAHTVLYVALLTAFFLFVLLIGRDKTRGVRIIWGVISVLAAFGSGYAILQPKFLPPENNWEDAFRSGMFIGGGLAYTLILIMGGNGYFYKYGLY